MKPFLYFIFLFALPHFTFCQNNRVQMEGRAGAYSILVDIETPQMVPGTAKVSVVIENGEISAVKVNPIYFQTEKQDTTHAKSLHAIVGKKGHFSGSIKLKSSQASCIQIIVNGEQGQGSVLIPLPISTPGSLKQDQHVYILGLSLALLCFTLLNLRAYYYKRILLAGNAFLKTDGQKKSVLWGLGVLSLGLLSFVGINWGKPDHLPRLTGQARVINKKGDQTIQIQIDTANWKVQKRSNLLSTLVPDQGKLMHTFLIRIPGLDVFAHLHPERTDSSTFETHFPSLPSGKYLIYSDLVRYNGVRETITDTLVVNTPQTVDKPVTSVHSEDTFVLTDPINAPGVNTLDADVIICGKPGTKTVFRDGSYAIWAGRTDQALEAGKVYPLNFEMYNPDGTACLPEPYLGQMGHAMVLHIDGSQFQHLHPGGSFPTVAQNIFENKLADSTYVNPDSRIFKGKVDAYLSRLRAMTVLEREEFLMTEMGMYDLNDNGMVGMEHGSLISFPYTFPKPGRYRIFLQVKRNEKVLTGAFDVKVTPALP